MFIILNTDYVQLCFHYKSDLRISIARKFIGIIRIVHLNLETWKGFKGTVIDRAMSYLHEWSIEITHIQSV